MFSFCLHSYTFRRISSSCRCSYSLPLIEIREACAKVEDYLQKDKFGEEALHSHYLIVETIAYRLEMSDFSTKTSKTSKFSVLDASDGMLV